MLASCGATGKEGKLFNQGIFLKLALGMMFLSQ
jgi:hypothetical protein